MTAILVPIITALLGFGAMAAVAFINRKRPSAQKADEAQTLVETATGLSKSLTDQMNNLNTRLEIAEQKLVVQTLRSTLLSQRVYALEAQLRQEGIVPVAEPALPTL